MKSSGNAIIRRYPEEENLKDKGTNSITQMDKQANDSAFFSPQGVTKCQNIETMLSLMAMVGGFSEHMLTSWSSYSSNHPETKIYVCVSGR